MRRFKFLFIAAAAALVSACASGPQIRIDKDPAADMSAYKTFGFFEQLPTDQARYSTLTSTRLKLAVTNELQRLGYTYDERAPQLRVNFFVRVTDKQDIRSTPSAGRVGRYVAWAGYPRDLETVEYKAGTLSIDLVDTRSNALVWQGMAAGKLSEEAMRNPGGAIDEVVAGIFRNFPNPPKK
jgi:hypothetical protein